MKLIHVTAVSVRIIGIIFLLKALFSIPVWVEFIDQWATSVAGNPTKSFYLCALIAQVLISLIAILLPSATALTLLPKGYANIELQSANAKAFEMAAFTILGVYIISSAIPDAVQNIIFIIQLNAYTGSGDISMQLKKYVTLGAVDLVRLGLGAYLVWGIQSFSDLLSKIRGRNS